MGRAPAWRGCRHLHLPRPARGSWFHCSVCASLFPSPRRAEKLGLGRLPAWLHPRGMPPSRRHGPVPPSSPPALASCCASWEVLRTVKGLAGDGHPCDPPPPGPGVVPAANRQRSECYLDLSFLIVPAFISLGEKRRGNPRGAAAGKGEEGWGRSGAQCEGVAGRPWRSPPWQAEVEGGRAGRRGVCCPLPPWMSSRGTASPSDTETALNLAGKHCQVWRRGGLSAVGARWGEQPP